MRLWAWLVTVVAVAMCQFGMVMSEEEELVYACPEGGAMHGNSDGFHFRGTALGGYMVLEPWITPSLFYQFLGEDKESKVGMDSMSFCKSLGPKEANRQLRRHWETWVTESIIENLANIGVDTLRLPVGDWMYRPYGDFPGCWDGALEEVDRALSLCEKYNISVIIDVHCMKGSQNGLDNGGSSLDVKWWSENSTLHFEHWGIREADWIGRYNRTTRTYKNLDIRNIIHALHVVESIALRYENVPTVIGIEPLNEPWQFTPIEALKQFYWDSYTIIQCIAPRMFTLLQDSFRLDVNVWGGFMKGCKNYAFDTHIYQAWAWGGDEDYFVNDACNAGNNLRFLESHDVPVVVGEWSLGTDNCAMWLNGFNDNLDGYPKVECKMVKCADPYMGTEQPGTPVDPNKGKQGPFGTGESTPEYGMCPIDKDFHNDDEVMKRLGKAKIYAFDIGTHGFFFWNFRTELEEKWDYQRAVTKGWLPTASQRNSVEYSKELEDICNAKTSTLSSFSLWHVLIIFVLLIAAWWLYTWCLRRGHQGYNAIPATSIPPRSEV